MSDIELTTDVHIDVKETLSDDGTDIDINIDMDLDAESSVQKATSNGSLAASSSGEHRQSQVPTATTESPLCTIAESPRAVPMTMPALVGRQFSSVSDSLLAGDLDDSDLIPRVVAVDTSANTKEVVVDNNTTTKEVAVNANDTTEVIASHARMHVHAQAQAHSPTLLPASINTGFKTIATAITKAIDKALMIDTPSVQEERKSVDFLYHQPPEKKRCVSAPLPVSPRPRSDTPNGTEGEDSTSRRRSLFSAPEEQLPSDEPSYDGKPSYMKHRSCVQVMVAIMFLLNLACIAFGAYWLHSGTDIELSRRPGVVDGTIPPRTLGGGVLVIGVCGVLVLVAYMWARTRLGVLLSFQYWIPLCVVVPFAVFTISTSVWILWSTRDGDLFSDVTAAFLGFIFAELFARILHAMGYKAKNQGGEDHTVDLHKQLFDRRQRKKDGYKEIKRKFKIGAHARQQTSFTDDDFRNLHERLQSVERHMGGYPRNAYSLLLVMFPFYIYLTRNRKKPRYSRFFRNMFVPATCLVLSQLVQVMFVSFVLIKTGPLCVCTHPKLVDPWLAWGAVTLYVVSVYLDIQDTYNLIDFQLLTNTESHIVRESRSNVFGSFCLIITSIFFATKLMIAVFLIIIAAPFLFSSTNTSEMLLNSLSLIFILEIDDLLFKYAVTDDSSLGKYVEMYFGENEFPRRRGSLMEKAGKPRRTAICLLAGGTVTLFMFTITAVHRQCENLFFYNMDYIHANLDQAPKCLVMTMS